MKAAPCRRVDTIAPTPPALKHATAADRGRTRLFDLHLTIGAVLLAGGVLAHAATPLPPGVFAGLLAATLIAGGVLRRIGLRAEDGTDDARRLAAELQATVERLASSEERYRAMVENAGDPILTFDLNDRVTSLNGAAERLFGWDRAALIGAPARRLVADESVRALQKWTRAHLLTPTETAELEMIAVHREGRILHLDAHAAVLRSQGVPVGVEVVCRDATVRKELDRLRADFLAMIGHDIRNPLGAIFGYTEMMLDSAHPVSKEHRDLLLRINTNTRTVLTLVGNFLDASKIDAGHVILERRDVDLNGVVRRTADQYMAHAQLTGIALHMNLAAELPDVCADGLQVERIVANLVTNAIKFTPRGGSVTLATERLPSSVAVSVSDTGPGIPPHEFSRIFQRYARSGDRSQEGTGLGLYIVGTLVEAHGGFVTIDSTPGAGTTFTVYLPISDWRATDVQVPLVSAYATTH